MLSYPNALAAILTFLTGVATGAYAFERIEAYAQRSRSGVLRHFREQLFSRLFATHPLEYSEPVMEAMGEVATADEREAIDRVSVRMAVRYCCECNGQPPPTLPGDGEDSV